MNIGGDRVSAVFEELWQQMIADAPERFWRQLGYGVVAFVSEIPAPSMNGVFVFRNDVDVHQVRTLLMEVSRANVPFCLQARPALRGALAGVADELGMVPDEDVPLMVLEDPTPLRSAAQLDGLTVRLLAEGEQAVHEDLLAAGFEIPSEMARTITRFMGAVPGLREFVGEVAGTGVTTAVTLPSSDASFGVFNVATPPEQRRHGYGAAVTASAALYGLDRGATFAWLQSSVAGFLVYQRLGFQVVESWPVWVTPSK
jgi:GNAT superfamily N-acetyltransferase